MDTRTKILSREEASQAASAGALVVSGYFDPMLAGHAERLQGLKQPGRKLLVVIHSRQDAILPARARAELVAALACVDAVTESVEVTPEVSLCEEDAAGQQRLIAHVHQRQQAVS